MRQKQRWLTFIDNLSIQKKFILLYLVCVLIPLIVVQAFVLTNTTAEIRAREQQSTAMSMNRAFTTIESQMTAAISLSNAVATDTQIMRQVFGAYAGPIPYFVTYYDSIRPQIFRYLLSYLHQISNIELYVENPTILSGGQLMRMDEDVQAMPWYLDGLQPMQAIAYIHRSSTNSLRPRISVIRPFSGKGMGLLKVDLNIDLINRAIYQEAAYMHLYLLDPYDHVVSHTGSFLDFSADDFAKAPTTYDLQMHFAEGTPYNGWRLVAQVNTQAMQRSVTRTVLFSIGLALVLGLFAAVIALTIARSFLHRSNALLSHMDAMAEGQFIRIEGDPGADEIGEVIEHYNAMSAQVAALIDEVYVLELQKKDLDLERLRAELKYLQAQIDPHFLFNTLNAILVVCMKHGYDEATPILRSLSKILRRMADTSDDLMPLRTEMDFVRMYLDIMRFRFADKLSYEIDIAPETLDVLVPKFTIQALVENACKHSLEHLTVPGIVRIHAVAAEEHMRLTVSDNGLGMPPERLEALLRGLRGEAHPVGGIGLVNVTRRLSLYYGDTASYAIESTPALGTVITLSIPITRKGEEPHAYSDFDR